MLTFIVTLFLMTNAQAQETPQPAAKKINTNLFEQDSEGTKEKTKSFTAKVKVVREETDGVEVFFEGDGNTGAHFLHRAVEHYAKILKDLEDSKKPQGAAVSVTVDAEKRIKSVEKAQSKFKEPPKNPNEKWDFSLPSGN